MNELISTYVPQEWIVLFVVNHVPFTCEQLKESKKNILDLNCTFFIDILLDCEFKDRRDCWFWCQTLTTEVTWLCLSNQEGELTWSHSFLIAGFVVHASEWSEFLYSARMLKPEELSLIDFPRRKIHLFWLTENIIMGNSTRDNEIMNFFK